MGPLIDLLLMVAMIWVLFVVWRLFGINAEQKQTQKRIERIKNRKVSTAKTTDMRLRRQTNKPKGIVYWVTKPLPNFKRLGDRLERAGVDITPKQYVFRRLMWMLGIAFVISVVLKKSLVLGLSAGVVLGVWLPMKLLQRAINKQSKAFLKLFPDGIDLIVRGLRSGLPVSESLVLVSQEVPAPVGTVFGTISNTMKLGVPMEKALQETAHKLDLTEFNFFTTCIVLQRETGGNLSEILNNLSEVLRGRFIMQMKIKAMSSEARASSYIIGALPFVVILAVGVLTPDYMLPLINDYRGNICAAVAAGMMTFGMWIMNRMTKFEI